MDQQVEFQDEDQNDPLIDRNMERVKKPLFTSALMYFGVVKNEKQAGYVLACFAVLLMTLSFSVIAKAFFPEHKGDLARYPAQDTSRGF